MTPLRLFVGSVLVAFVAVLGVATFLDRAAPVTVVVKPMPRGEMRVAISGAVATPGIVSVPHGARLSDVADAAGGFARSADFTQLNLAGRVGDGESIVIPSMSELAGSGSNAVSSSAGNALLNINTATAEELEELPGIGEVLAGRIVGYRTTNGPFRSVDELTSVDGISHRMAEELRPLVTVTDGG